MSSSISVQQIKRLRNQFREYLRKSYPRWSESTVSTHWSDAFFAFNNDVGIDFWSCFTDNESLRQARNKIRDFFANQKQADDAEERADFYLSAMKYLKAFLDEKHPPLATEWGDKSISNTHLKTAFQNWMHQQKKSNGESYRSSTINTYTQALRSATGKLNLSDTVHSDLFYYSDSDEFESAYKIITSAPNFGQIDVEAGNAAYSRGLALYAAFLRELGSPSSWIFQGNPKYYDVIGAVNDLDAITWAVNQYPKQIKKGDSIYIWVSGSDGGIIASGTIEDNPEMKEPIADDIYNRETARLEPYLGVDIQLKQKFTDTPILRTFLMADERTKSLEIIRRPSGTNFRVTKEQEAVIENILTGGYEPVPVITPSEPSHTPVTIVDKKRYWMYAPGENSYMWDEFYANGIMGIGWDELGDLTQYSSKKAMKEQMKVLYGPGSSYKNAGHATWQFANEIKPGDVVFVKRGLRKIIGRGVVTSEYIFVDSRDSFRHTHRVDWTHRGEWNHDGQIVMKTLTDITPYTDYYKSLENMFVIATDNDLETDETPAYFESYTKDDFLSDVFMDEERYETLKGLLLKKKNLILQGAPGVGKTYAAERLAYSIMGERDTNRVQVVQFHQSYSYEDFIMGYRPNGNGFSLANGPFYKFCKDAEPDDGEYFFIIDEINRGNLSKIFGELLMLIENDKRGEKHAIRLLYSDEQFSVPENVHIIGMMNTADRSLALIDYALRRRFAFFEFEPAFLSGTFKAYQTSIANKKFDALISTVVAMNFAIAEDASLGSGFRIGHSYFCPDEDINDAWLSQVVEYELVPLLKEYWFDEPSKVEQWVQKLRGAIRD